jgi:sugar O-acyltransferase (sialic acid O-acetyltransferase NeuD family)
MLSERSSIPTAPTGYYVQLYCFQARKVGTVLLLVDKGYQGRYTPTAIELCSQDEADSNIDPAKERDSEMDSVRPLLILGTHLLALELMDLVSEIPGYDVVGLVENQDPDRCNAKIEGYPVHWIEDLGDLYQTHWAICGISTTHRSHFIDQAKLKLLPFATLIHPTARISSRSTLAEGVIVSPGVIVASHTSVGRFVFVNRGVLIGHHTRIGDYVTIQPGANVAGACEIGEGTYIGMGAIVIDRVRIGSHSIVGAGAVVTKDVPDNVQVVGVPARVVKENIPGK